MLMALGNFIKAVASLMIVIMITVVGFFGFRKWEEYERARHALEENKVLIQKNKELDLENQKLALANRLLKVDYQLAKIRMVEQYKDPDSQQLISVVQFWEVNEEGQPMYPDPNDPNEPDPERTQSIKIKGKQAFVYGQVAKFDDKFVEEGDPLRGTAMFAFKGMYGEREAPENAQPLYSKRTQPTAYYRGSAPTPFEQELWEKFWDIANDTKQMEKHGLRAMQGTSVSMELRKGNTYIVELRSTGDVTFKPLPQNYRKVRPWERQ